MSTERDPRWDALERAEPELRRRFARHGVVGIEYVAGFPEVPDVGVWLIVSSDQEREALSVPFDQVRTSVEQSSQRRLLDELADEVAAILRAEAAGLSLGEVTGVVQSQETVDRDFNANWFYAMR